MHSACDASLSLCVWFRQSNPTPFSFPPFNEQKTKKEREGIEVPVVLLRVGVGWRHL
jgi:hypothetical protein